MKIIGFLFILLLLLGALTLAFGFSFLRMIFRTLFGSSSPQPQAKSSSKQKAKQTSKQQTSSSATKIFKQDDGEYVDFEEIKD